MHAADADIPGDPDDEPVVTESNMPGDIDVETSHAAREHIVQDVLRAVTLDQEVQKEIEKKQSFQSRDALS